MKKNKLIILTFMILASCTVPNSGVPPLPSVSPSLPQSTSVPSTPTTTQTSSATPTTLPTNTQIPSATPSFPQFTPSPEVQPSPVLDSGISGAIKINSDTDNCVRAREQKIVSDKTSSFAVTWSCYQSDAKKNLQLKFFNNFGVSQNNNPFTIAELPGMETLTDYDLAMNTNGQLVITWLERVSDGRRLMVKKYQNNGNILQESKEVFRTNKGIKNLNISINEQGEFIITALQVQSKPVQPNTNIISGVPADLSLLVKRYGTSSDLISSSEIALTASNSFDNIKPFGKYDSQGNYFLLWNDTSLNLRKFDRNFNQVAQKKDFTGTERLAGASFEGGLTSQHDLTVDKNGNVFAVYLKYYTGSRAGLYMRKFSNNLEDLSAEVMLAPSNNSLELPVSVGQEVSATTDNDSNLFVFYRGKVTENTEGLLVSEFNEGGLVNRTDISANNNIAAINNFLETPESIATIGNKTVVTWNYIGRNVYFKILE